MVGLLLELVDGTVEDDLQLIVTDARFKKDFFPFEKGDFVSVIQLTERDDETVWVEQCNEKGEVTRAARVMIVPYFKQK